MRQRYEQGEEVIILDVDNRQAKLGFRVGQTYKVWIDYEDLIYLASPVKEKTSEDFFYPQQLKKK
jgi:hypothetical protein